MWHQSDREANHVPEKLRHLDQEASWGKSAYHGWVYGHSLHLSCNRAGFPKLVLVSPAATWKNGKYAQAYPHFLEQEPVNQWLKCRKTAEESPHPHA